MNAVVHCTNFSKTSAIENFVREKFEPLIERIAAEKVRLFEVHLSVENSREQPGEDIFVCQVHMSGRRLTEIVLKKTSNNMYRAISAAAKALHSLVPKAKDRYRKKVRGLHHRTDKWHRWQALMAGMTPALTASHG